MRKKNVSKHKSTLADDPETKGWKNILTNSESPSSDEESNSDDESIPQQSNAAFSTGFVGLQMSPISPLEFEKLVHEYLIQLGKPLNKFEVKHDIILKVNDGDYQIDVRAEFEVLNVKIIVLIQCKRHRSPIKREVVQILHEKIRSTGAHKRLVF